MDDLGAVESGLELFLQLLSKLGEANGEHSALLKEVVPNLLEKGFSIFAQPEVSDFEWEVGLCLVERDSAGEDSGAGVLCAAVDFLRRRD